MVVVEQTIVVGVMCVSHRPRSEELDAGLLVGRAPSPAIEKNKVSAINHDGGDVHGSAGYRISVYNSEGVHP